VIDWWLYVALVVALSAGFFLGLKQASANQKKSLEPVGEYYFKGLNYLLNEESDAAIETFIRALEVNSETLETHLALGKLLRNRGEVDRAIRIHQNLLARPGITLDQAQQAQYELATDFVKSGLLDRAESLLLELVAKDGNYKVLGLGRLLEVYRDEKEWQKGLGVLQLLSGSRLSRSYDEWGPTKSHFCCELAELAIFSQDHKTARQWLRKALVYERDGFRASLLLGRLEISVGNPNKGLSILEGLLVGRHLKYASEILPHLSGAYESLGKIERYRAFLCRISELSNNPVIMIALSELILRQSGDRAAAEFVAKSVIDAPSGIGLNRLLDYYLLFTEGKTNDYLSSLKQVIGVVVDDDMHYQCDHCGFRGREMHWLCPSCKTWGSLHLKHAGIEG